MQIQNKIIEYLPLKVNKKVALMPINFEGN